MRVVYPYNEILPKKSAHDVYIFHACHSLAEQGADVTLAIGKGSWPDSQLHTHYKTTHLPQLTIKRLPIVRKNNPFGISWNRIFFASTQKLLKKLRPDVVLLSVEKQADYHLKRKIPSSLYVYEVHQLAWYPELKMDHQAIDKERDRLQRSDLVTVTTHALKEILIDPPYSITTPIEIVPLGVQATPLPPPFSSSPLTFGYVGQLYKGQGIETLLRAFQHVPEGRLKIIGGTPKEVESLKQLSRELHVEHRVEFLGFHPPATLSSQLQDIHIFVAPFSSEERMPYVAHTKLYEYAMWRRPFIAPRLPAVTEHFPTSTGILLFEPDSISSLASTMKQAIDIYGKQMITPFDFSWQKRAARFEHILSKHLRNV